MSTRSRCLPRGVALGAACSLLLTCAAMAAAQAPDTTVIRVQLPIGQSYPVTTTAAITQVSVASPDVADAVVVGEHDIVINAKAPGETDVILWEANGPRQHYRVSVHSPADREQIILSVKFAEVRRDFLAQLGVSGIYRDTKGDVRAGTGQFNSDNAIDQSSGKITLPSTLGFGTILTNFGTDRLLALLDAEEQRGNARLLAEPNLMAANKAQANFLAGGEIPIPIAQASSTGVPLVTIVFREFGVRLNFTGEIVSDSLVKLKVQPEVSSLDFSNAIEISGFRIPALRTRRIESTVDVRRDESLIISGMFDDERERVRTGVPLLMDVPILGALFSSTRWQRNETELIVIVTPVVFDPLRPPSRSSIRLQPDTTLPARGALEKRLVPPRPAKKDSVPTKNP
ncbi:MAG TPA: pilus assembly protein N-terminal domain-containing protein [Gemmatimonadaceae bacterium]